MAYSANPPPPRPDYARSVESGGRIVPSSRPSPPRPLSEMGCPAWADPDGWSRAVQEVEEALAGDPDRAGPGPMTIVRKP